MLRSAVELRDGLDPSKWSGAIQLEQIYVFLFNELMAANVNKDARRIVAWSSESSKSTAILSRFLE